MHVITHRNYPSSILPVYIEKRKSIVNRSEKLKELYYDVCNVALLQEMFATPKLALETLRIGTNIAGPLTSVVVKKIKKSASNLRNVRIDIISPVIHFGTARY